MMQSMFQEVQLICLNNSNNCGDKIISMGRNRRVIFNLNDIIIGIANKMSQLQPPKILNL